MDCIFRRIRVQSTIKDSRIQNLATTFSRRVKGNCRQETLFPFWAHGNTRSKRTPEARKRFASQGEERMNLEHGSPPVLDPWHVPFKPFNLGTFTSLSTFRALQ